MSVFQCTSVSGLFLPVVELHPLPPHLLWLQLFQANSYPICFSLRWFGKSGGRIPIPHMELGFPGSSDGKESACYAEDLGSISGSGRSPRERNGNPLQHSCLENPIDRGTWWATVHGVAKSQTRLSSDAFTFSLHLDLGTPFNKQTQFTYKHKIAPPCSCLKPSSISFYL